MASSFARDGVGTVLTISPAPWTTETSVGPLRPRENDKVVEICIKHYVLFCDKNNVRSTVSFTETGNILGADEDVKAEWNALEFLKEHYGTWSKVVVERNNSLRDVVNGENWRREQKTLGLMDGALYVGSKVPYTDRNLRNRGNSLEVIRDAVRRPSSLLVTNVDTRYLYGYSPVDMYVKQRRIEIKKITRPSHFDTARPTIFDAKDDDGGGGGDEAKEEKAAGGLMSFVSNFLQGGGGDGEGDAGTSFAAALGIGLIETASRYLVPDLATITFFSLVILFLAVRPQGLLGRA